MPWSAHTSGPGLIAFLKALKGELPKEYIKEPALPSSGPDTQKPDPS